MSIKIQQGLGTKFENLLTGNTLTEEQANRIKAVINKSENINQVNLVESKTKLEQSRKIYMDSKEINQINSLKDLVDNGNITQDQAEKIIMNKIYQCQIKWLLIYFKNLFNEN